MERGGWRGEGGEGRVERGGWRGEDSVVWRAERGHCEEECGERRVERSTQRGVHREERYSRGQGGNVECCGDVD